MVNFTINGQPVQAHPGQTILEAAQQAGVTIPTLCYHKDLSPHGGCRMCIVEVAGARGPLTSCTTPATEGMQVVTESPAIIEHRRMILKLLLSAYYDRGDNKDDGRENELLHWAEFYAVSYSEFAAKEPRFAVNSDPNPFVWVDMNKCILCSRCVRACAEVQGRFVWGLENRGFDSHVVAGSGVPMLEARCESCGACVAYCPTGALDNKMSLGAGAAEKKVTTTCTYCGVGCQFDLNVRDNHIVRVTSNPSAPVNGMRLCVKGRYGYDFVHHEERLTEPLVREYLLQGKERPHGDRGPWVQVDWETALNLTARKIAAARDTFGADSIGVLTSAKCTNEENYVMNKFARQVVGTNSIDHCARL